MANFDYSCDPKNLKELFESSTAFQSILRQGREWSSLRELTSEIIKEVYGPDFSLEGRGTAYGMMAWRSHKERLVEELLLKNNLITKEWRRELARIRKSQQEAEKLALKSRWSW